MKHLTAYKLFEELSGKELFDIVSEVFDMDDFPTKTIIGRIRMDRFIVPYSISSGESERGVWVRFMPVGESWTDGITIDDYKKIYPIIESKVKYLLESKYIYSFGIRIVYVPHGMKGHNRYLSESKILSPVEVVEKMGQIIPANHEFDPGKCGLPGEKIVYDKTGFDYIDLILKT